MSAQNMYSFNQLAKKELGHYVYAYYDPDDKENVPFYVGKGQNNRAYAHLNIAIRLLIDKENIGEIEDSKPEDKKEIEKIKKIQSILERGRDCIPTIKIIKYGLKNDDEALLVESALIDMYRKNLTNLVRGHHSVIINAKKFNEKCSSNLLRIENFKSFFVDTCKRVLLLKIGFNPDEHPEESSLKEKYENDDYIDPEWVYNKTRAAWILSQHISTEGKNPVRHVISIFKGEGRILGIFKVRQWLLPTITKRKDNRIEFEGVADDFYKDYIGKFISPDLLGQNNPVKYLSYP